jgi:hypothetical protein
LTVSVQPSARETRRLGMELGRLNLWQGAQPIAFEALRIRAFEFGDESMSPPYPRGLTGYGATTPHAQRPCDARIA